MAISRVFLTPLIVACALFMENMDATVIATSLPAMALDMGESPIALKLAMTSYLVSLAVFIPISGWMADRFGARTVFRTAIGVFMFGSILCGMSHTLAEFVAARFFQGIGGAMMVPVGRLVILRTVSKADLVKALSYLTIPALLGPVIGPPLGGFITTYFHWRWIFFINIPISIVGIYLANRYIQNLREEQTAPLDWIGFLLSAIGCSCLMFGLASAGRHLVDSDISLVCIAIGVTSLLAYVWHAFHCEHPLLNLRLLSIPTLRMNIYGGSLFRIGIGALPFLLPLLFQLGFGMSPFQSGLLTCVSSMGAMFVKTITSVVLKRYGFRTVLIYNTLLGAASMAAFGALAADTPHVLVGALLLIGGCVRSMQFTSLNAIAYADISPHQMSQATSLTSVAQQLAIGMGVTVGGFVLQISNHVQGHATIVSADFWPTFLVIGIIAMGALPFALKLRPDAGEEMTGRRS